MERYEFIIQKCDREGSELTPIADKEQKFLK